MMQRRGVRGWRYKRVRWQFVGLDGLVEKRIRVQARIGNTNLNSLNLPKTSSKVVIFPLRKTQAGYN